MASDLEFNMKAMFPLPTRRPFQTSGGNVSERWESASVKSKAGGKLISTPKEHRTSPVDVNFQELGLKHSLHPPQRKQTSLLTSSPTNRVNTLSMLHGNHSQADFNS